MTDAGDVDVQDGEDADAVHRRYTPRELLVKRVEFADEMMGLIERDINRKTSQRTRRAITQARTAVAKLYAIARPVQRVPVQALAQRNGAHHAQK